ncbi:MAG: hypothetical protein U0T83_08645 [Bacteriovoracaceae bacterium]
MVNDDNDSHQGFEKSKNSLIQITSEWLPTVKLVDPLFLVLQRARLTERMQREILYLSERFANLKQVSRHTSVGNKTIYKRHYTQLELEWRKQKQSPAYNYRH